MKIENTNRVLVESVTYGMTSTQTMIIENLYNHFSPLIETDLSTEQIKNVFDQIEKKAENLWSNRTVVGKSKDIVVLVNDTINNVGKWLQDTTPVKAFDQKFEQLKQTIDQKYGSDSKIVSGIKQLSSIAKKHPIKTAAIIGIMTVIASLAAGPIGGAIAGQVLRGTTELLKGEKLSTAVGKGMKTAAFGYLAASVIRELGDWLSTLRANVVFDENTATVSFKVSYSDSAPNYYTDDLSESVSAFNILVANDDAEYILRLVDTFRNGSDTEALKAFELLSILSREIVSGEYDQWLRSVGVKAINNDGLFKFIQHTTSALQSAAQGAAATSGNKKANESADAKYKKLFYVVEQKMLVEAGISDSIKNSAKSVANKLSKVGKNLTTKVTADKLYKAWEKAGSPTDLSALQSFLKNQGVDDKIITDVSNAMATPKNKPKRTSTKTRVEPTVSGTQQQQQQQQAQPAKRLSPAQKYAEVFKNPEELRNAWNKFVQNNGQVTFELKAAIKDMWMSAGGTVIENKKK